MQRRELQRAESPHGVVEPEPRTRLNPEKVTGAEGLEKPVGCRVSCDQGMLAVVQDLPRNRILKRCRPPACGGLLFKEEYGNSLAGEKNAGRQTAESGADYNDRFHRRGPACPRSGASARLRANQEYLSVWLSQYRNAISAFRKFEIEMRRSKTLYPDASILLRRWA